MQETVEESILSTDNQILKQEAMDDSVREVVDSIEGQMKKRLGHEEGQEGCGVDGRVGWIGLYEGVVNNKGDDCRYRLGVDGVWGLADSGVQLLMKEEQKIGVDDDVVFVFWRFFVKLSTVASL